MTLTPEQIAQGWIEWNGGPCPIKDERTVLQVQWSNGAQEQSPDWVSRHYWAIDDLLNISAYRIIEAHGADAAPAHPTPWPQSYADLVFSPDGWSQTIIVDGKRPEWLRDDDRCCAAIQRATFRWLGRNLVSDELAIRVRRREPKRETRTCWVTINAEGSGPFETGSATVDFIDGKPDLSTLKLGDVA